MEAKYNPGNEVPSYQMIPQTQVVTAQPTLYTTTTVVTQQPTAPRMWNSGICDCFNDIKSCCCAFWFTNCYYACLATRMGESCCVGFSGDDAGCVPGAHIAMRTKIRAQHGIQGDICSDCCMMHFCKPCAMCQLSREMDSLGYPPQTC